MSLPHLDTWDDVAAQLRRLRAQDQQPTFRELVRRVRDQRVARGLSAADAPGHSTVHDCFRDGRRRMDLELLADLGRALGLDEADARDWEAACFAVQNRIDSSRVVSVTEVVHRSPDFIGRSDEFTQVRATPGTWVITGLPGIGKTQLALRLADGWVADGAATRVLVADLRGHHDHRAPADGEAMLVELHRVLSGASVTDVDLARRRLGEVLSSEGCILVLDDAASSAQVASILPPEPRLSILVTSRRRLDLPDVKVLGLQPLNRDNSVALLAARAGRVLTPSDRTTAEEIADSLGGLPLALDLTARRIANNPAWSWADHRGALAEQSDRLRLPGPLDQAFTLSYQRLSSDAGRVLRLIAHQPGASYASTEIAALTGMAVSSIEPLLAELTAASLAADADGRFELHDLIRTFASAASLTEDSPSEREQARGRLLDHYLSTATEAVAACGLAPRVSRADYSPPETSLAHDDALAWLAAELENLLALADPRLCGVRPKYISSLSACLCRLLDVQGHYRAAALLHRQALDVAERAGDIAGQARSHALLGQVLHRFDLFESRVHLRRALELVDLESDPDSHASAAMALGIVAYQVADYDTAESYLRLALETVRDYDTTRLPGPLLGNLATVLADKGDHEGAAKQYERALHAALEAGDRESAAISSSNLSSEHFIAGDYTAAKEAAESAIALATTIGSQTAFAVARINLAAALTKLGEYGDARTLYEALLSDLRRDGHLMFEVGGSIGFGDLLLAVDNPEAAREAYLRAGQLADEHGFRYWQGRHHLSLGDLEEGFGNLSAAVSHYVQALTVFEETGAGEVDEVRGKLEALSASPSP